jgi:hypothetical protein
LPYHDALSTGWLVGSVTFDPARGLPIQSPADDFARDWEEKNPGEMGSLENPADAGRLVRHALPTEDGN